METNLSFSTLSSPHDSTRVAFDRAAPSYDADFETLPATQRLRSLIRTEMLRVFKSGDNILELNCGTGTDALFLAQYGVKVHATDASPAMINVVNAKREQTLGKELITTEVLSFDNLPKLRPRNFDGVLSNLGGINCCNDLSSLAGKLGDCIRPDGFLIICILGRYSPWEIASFLGRGKFKEALRRFTSGNANVQGVDIAIQYYSAKTITHAFHPGFKLVSTQGLNIITPPPASVRANKRLRWILPSLQWIEDRIAKLSLFNRAGDHVLMVFRRRAS